MYVQRQRQAETERQIETDREKEGQRQGQRDKERKIERKAQNTVESKIEIKKYLENGVGSTLPVTPTFGGREGVNYLKISQIRGALKKSFSYTI